MCDPKHEQPSCACAVLSRTLLGMRKVSDECCGSATPARLSAHLVVGHRFMACTCLGVRNTSSAPSLILRFHYLYFIVYRMRALDVCALIGMHTLRHASASDCACLGGVHSSAPRHALLDSCFRCSLSSVNVVCSYFC